MSLKMPSEVQGITRATSAETYAQIEQDFKDALADLPKKAELSATTSVVLPAVLLRVCWQRHISTR